MLKAYSAFLDKIDKVLSVSLVLLGSAMTLIMLYQIGLRYFFNASTIWAEELTRYLFAWSVLLAASMAIRKNSHLRIDMLLDILSPRGRLVMQLINYTVLLGFLVYLAVLSFKLVSNTTNNLSAGLRVPMALPYACVLLGSVLMALSCVEFLCKLVQEFRQLSLKGREGES